MRRLLRLRAPVTAVVAAAAIGAAACGKQRPAAPAPPPPPPLREWPRGSSAPFAVTDSLTLVIPLQYQRSAIAREGPPRPLFPSASGHTEAHFDFFLPDFSGYTLENYRREADPNKVEVVYLHEADPHEAEPDAPGEYPPNMLKRLLADTLNSKDYRDLYGLRCYRSRAGGDRLTCYGSRAAGEDILLYVPAALATAAGDFPTMKANYFSRRYGGVRIAWRTHTGNLPHWRDIDAHIWQFIDAWNVAAAAADVAAQPAAGQQPAPARQ